MSRVRTYVINPLREFLRTETSGGIVLLAATIAAVVWANSPWSESYSDLWHIEMGRGAFRLSLQEWVDDGLMMVFFFVVGLEIKRELVTGELRDPRKAALPVFAALGGMGVPAAVYLLLNGGGPHARGWGIPVATDIAFSVGVLVLLGRRVPSGLKIFLLTLAIVDDIGGIVVIAIFYTGGLSFGWFAAAAATVGAILVLKRVGATRPIYYLPLGVIAWIATFKSGVHPTIAGVALGLLTPARPISGRPVLEELEHLLHPLSSFVIVPVFALANAGVSLSARDLSAAFGSRVFWGIASGLLAGKTIGVSLATGLAVLLRLGRVPTGVRAPHVVGVATVSGVGFTVALFVAGLAFQGQGPTDVAKVGIFVGSVSSAVLGAAVLSRVRRVREPVEVGPTAAGVGE